MADIYKYKKPSELTTLADITGAVIAPVVKSGITYQVQLSSLVGAQGATGSGTQGVQGNQGNQGVQGN
jgi:hypothetical protein